MNEISVGDVIVANWGTREIVEVSGNKCVYARNELGKIELVGWMKEIKPFLKSTSPGVWEFVFP